MLRMFYFSGTGNARNVARWMVEEWGRAGRPAEAIDLASLASPGNAGRVTLAADDELGLASPTHGFNFPPITLSFLLRLPRAPAHNRALVFNTRAGLLLRGLHIPGVSGVAQLLAALVLSLKGYRVVAMRPVDLPSNWISLHPGLRPDHVRTLHQRCRAIVGRSARRLLDGKRDLRALLDLPLDLALAPVALGYYLVGRFVFAKSFYASAACDGCGACITQCPLQAVRRVGGRPFWSYRCESCMRCMNLCPRRAVETAHGFVIGTLVGSSLLLKAVHPTLAIWLPALGRPGAVGEVARFVVDNGFLLGCLVLAYRLLSRLLANPMIERLVILTSLTHLPRWRRYRAPPWNRIGSSPERPTEEPRAPRDGPGPAVP